MFARLNLPTVAILNCCLPFGLPPKETVRRTEVVIIQFRLPQKTEKSKNAFFTAAVPKTGTAVYYLQFVHNFRKGFDRIGLYLLIEGVI